MSDDITSSGPTRAATESPIDAAAADQGRRRALKRIGYAAAVAPAMLVLMQGRSDAKPACDNPAWQLGLQRSGHSGC